MGKLMACGLSQCFLPTKRYFLGRCFDLSGFYALMGFSLTSTLCSKIIVFSLTVVLGVLN